MGLPTEFILKVLSSASEMPLCKIGEMLISYLMRSRKLFSCSIEKDDVK